MADKRTKFDRCAYCDALLEGDDASLHDPYCPHKKTLLDLKASNELLVAMLHSLKSGASTAEVLEAVRGGLGILPNQDHSQPEETK